MSQEPGITVTNKKVKHAISGANNLAVQEGHLLVQFHDGGRRGTVAVFAPGQWETAYYDEMMVTSGSNAKTAASF